MTTEQKGFNEGAKALKTWKKAPRTCTPPRSIQKRFPNDWKDYIKGWGQAVREAEERMRTR